MLLLIFLIIILICIVPLIIKLIKSKTFKKNQKTMFIILTISIILLITSFVIVNFIIPSIPHNDVSKEDRLLLESYILDNYGLELKVTESNVSHRGNIGINPGIEYYFVLKNKNRFEYRLDINELYEIDLKTILSKNPKLDLIQMK